MIRGAASAIAAVSISLAACGGPPAQPSARAAAPAPSASSVPLDIEAISRREVTPMPRARHVVSYDGAFEADVPSKTEPEWSKDGEAFNFTLGEHASGACRTFADGIDSATVILEAARNATEKRTVLAIHRPEYEVLLGATVTFLVVEYTETTPAGLAQGALKLAVHSTLEGALLCQYDDVGYHESFKSFVRKVVTTAKRRSKHTFAPPRFRQVELLGPKGKPVGYVESMSLARARGGVIVMQASHMINFTSLTSATAREEAETRQLDAHGVLLEGTFQYAVGSKPAANLALTRTAPSTYAVKGELGDEHVDISFTATTDLSTEYAKRKELAFIGSREGAAVVYFDYMPTIAVKKATSVSASSAGDGTVTLTLGDQTAHTTFDAKGMRAYSELRSPGWARPVVFERIFAQGEP